MSRRNARSSATPRCVIIADIRNKTGYDVMAHLTMEFFTKGLVPLHHYPLDINRVILNRYLF